MFKYLLFLSGIIVFSSCYKFPDTDNIALPSWEIEGIHIPLVNQTKTLKEIIEDDSTITWFPVDGEQSPGVLYYSQTENIEGTTVGEHLKLDQTDVNTSTKIGPITINDIAPVEANISISDWTNLDPGQTVPIPPLNVPNQETQFGEIDAFQEVEFNTGKIRVTILNNLPMEVTYSNFQILNEGGSEEAITKTIPSITIEANVSEVVEIEIVPKEIVTNKLMLRIDISTTGTGTDFVTLAPDAGTAITAELVETEITRVVAAIPENVITIDSSYTIDSGEEPIELALAEISSGSFLFDMQSSIDIETVLDITFHDLYDNQGNKYNIVETVPRNGTVQISEPDLAGWRIEPLVMTDELRYSVTATTLPTASDDYREITEHDSFSVSIQFTELMFSRVDGKFTAEFEMEEQTFEIDYGDIYDTFNFQEIKLEDSFIYLDLFTSTFLPVNINDATLTASNGIVTNTIFLDQISLPSSESIAVDVSELFDDMTQLLPTNFTFNGNAEVNPANERIEVTATDSIFGNANIEIPMKFMITGGSFTDVTDLDIDDDAKDEINNIQRISLTFELENGIPAGVSLVASVLDSLGNNILNIPTEDSEFDKIEVTAPLMDADGEMIETGKITQTIELSGEDVLTFLEGDKIEFLFQFETAPNINATNEIVRFRITDSISYRAWGEADYRFEN